MICLANPRVRAREYDIGLVVIDPLQDFCPGDENTAQGMAAFAKPLNVFAKLNAAVLVLHHPRKAGGTEGRAARGSGFLHGHMDILLEMARAEPHAKCRSRIITAHSRDPETPDEVVVELLPDASDYRVIGTQHHLRAKQLVETIQQVIGEADELGVTVAEIMADWPADQTPPKRRTLERTLKKGAGKHWLCVGNGAPELPVPLPADDAEPGARRWRASSGRSAGIAVAAPRGG